MTPPDPTEEILRNYFTEKVETMPARRPRGSRRIRRRAGLVVARIAVAAAIVLTVLLPFIGAGRSTPSARSFAVIHERFDTAEVVLTNIRVANSFMRTHFGGLQTNE